ncbi:MAG: hypothetical protein HQK89_02480 [Nitrospirae bacterium]|nr:hypothetical protein [Nitrospirota bacterium]
MLSTANRRKDSSTFALAVNFTATTLAGALMDVLLPYGQATRAKDLHTGNKFVLLNKIDAREP